MTVYARGATKERKVAALLELHDYLVYRSAGSHGNADLVALHPTQTACLIQVKADAKYPFAHFGPVERRDLLKEARRVGARAVLCWWPPGGIPSFRIGPDWDTETTL